MPRWNDDEAQRRLEALAALEGGVMNLGKPVPNETAPVQRLTLPTIDLSTPEARASFEANGYSQPQAAKLQTATAPAVMPRGDDYGIPDAAAFARQRPAAAPAPAAPVNPYADAEEADRLANNRRVLETAGRQLLSGLTRTPQQDVLAQPGTAVQSRKAEERQARLDAIKAFEAQTQAGFLDLKRNPAAKPTTEKPADPLLEDRRALLRAQTAKLLAPPKSTGKGAAAPTAPDEVPFGDDTFVYSGSADTPKDVRLVGAKAVREKASQWNTALAGMDSLEEALTEFVKNPTLQNKARLYAPALSAAGAVNSAIGQGAMSEAEKQAQFQALGINSTDPASLSAWVERAFGDDAKAREEMLSRVKGAKALAKRSVANAAQPYGYKPRGATAAPAGPAPAGGDVVKVRRKADGKTGSMPRAKVDTSKYEVISG